LIGNKLAKIKPEITIRVRDMSLGKVMVAGPNPAEGSNFAPDSLKGLDSGFV